MVTSAEADAAQFHVGSDNARSHARAHARARARTHSQARIGLSTPASASAAWAACVDLQPGRAARAQVTLLLVVPRGSDVARQFGRWSAASDDAIAARTELSTLLNSVELPPPLAERVRTALTTRRGTAVEIEK